MKHILKHLKLILKQIVFLNTKVIFRFCYFLAKHPNISIFQQRDKKNFGEECQRRDFKLLFRDKVRNILV